MAFRPDNIENLTLEQQIEKEKLSELFDIMREYRNSLESDDISFDNRQEINELVAELGGREIVEKYSYGRILLNKGDASYDPSDTSDKSGKIERVIRKICTKKAEKTVA